MGNKTLNLSLQYSKIIKQAVESPIQYNTVIISIYGCFEQYIDNIFNEYCHALYAIIENYDLTDKQAVKNAVEAFDNPKVGLGNNQELILTHGGNLKIILPVLIIKGYYYIREIICWQSKMIELKY